MNQTLNQLITWFQSKTCSKPVDANSYIRGWHDCIEDILRKIEELETAKEAGIMGVIKESLTTEIKTQDLYFGEIKDSEDYIIKTSEEKVKT